jgi:lysophospholipase L1-like esterase
MKSILCFGDSNTWGYNAENGERFPPDVRWTGVLQKELGDEYKIIEEGQNGRTTVWDDPVEGHKNGKKYLIPCLESHSPLDLVVIMLGTNDLKCKFSLSAFDVAKGAEVLVDIVLGSDVGRCRKPPKVLLISPIFVGDNIKDSWLGETFGFERSAEKSKKLAPHFKRVAQERGCEFLDAADIVTPSPIDAVHFDAGEHMKLGKAIAVKVRAILA